MNRRLNFFFFAVFFLITTAVNATHIVGGEMNYRYLGGNIYEVTLTVYRDCYNGQAPFDNPAIVAVYSPNGSLISTISVAQNPSQHVPNAINTPCLVPPTNVCYEVANYIFTTPLPPRAGGYILAYQRCCRNNTIVNLANVQGTGATYMATIPDPALASDNSNPVFTNWPPTFICKDAPFTFDHSATDLDGDSIAYELSIPLLGGSISTPVPNPPSSPPYTQVTYLNPYGLGNVLGGVPMTINSVTGKLTATPNSLGQFVYGVVAKEYRNGIFISETRRDFQVNVVPCPNITVASIFSPTIACGSLDAHFINTSYNAATYSWTFGDPTTLNDSSSLKHPVYSYPDTGDYMATLVAYSAINQACNDTARGLVHVYPVFMTGFGVTNDHCSPSFTFNDQSYGIGGTPTFWSWSFGDNSTTSDQHTQHTYDIPGTYNVTLISSTDSACTDTVVKRITVLQNPIANFLPSLDTCTFKLSLRNISLFGASYRWDFGDGIQGYTKQNPHQYLLPGTYDVTLMVQTDSFCVDTSNLTIFLPPLPEADFTYSVPTCDSLVTFVNNSRNATSWIWEFGDGETSSAIEPLHTYGLSGNVPVTFSAISDYGCKTTLAKDIYFISYKEVAFTPFEDSCSGLVSFFDVTPNASQYLWDFGDGESSTLKNPVHQYKKNELFQIKLTLNGESECVSRLTKPFKNEIPLGELLYVPNTFTPNGDGMNDHFTISVYRPCSIYSLIIYNRWGQKIVESDDAVNSNWDGTYHGEQCQNDLYVYILKGNGKERKGYINLMR